LNDRVHIETCGQRGPGIDGPAAPYLQLRARRRKGELKPAEGIWSLLKRSMANFAAADLGGLVRIVKRKLKKIQHRPHLIDGYLAPAGLTIEPGDHMHHEFNLVSLVRAKLVGWAATWQGRPSVVRLHRRSSSDLWAPRRWRGGC